MTLSGTALPPGGSPGNGPRAITNPSAKSALGVGDGVALSVVSVVDTMDVPPVDVGISSLVPDKLDELVAIVVILVVLVALVIETVTVDTVAAETLVLEVAVFDRAPEVEDVLDETEPVRLVDNAEDVP